MSDDTHYADGVADIVWTLPGNTPGRFPTTEVFELPFIASKRGIVNARAAQEFADMHLKDEVKEIKEGFECGIVLKGFSELEEGDVLEGYVSKSVERTEL